MIATPDARSSQLAHASDRTDSLREQLKKALVCLSLGNLVFIRRWYDLENLQSRALDYYRTVPPSARILEATLLASLLVAVALRLGWLWVERNPTARRRTLAHCVFLLLFIYPLESVRRYWNLQTGHYDLIANTALLIIEGVIAVGLVGRLRGSVRIVRAARSVALMLTLLFPALFLDFGLNSLSQESSAAFQDKPPVPLLPPHPGPGRRLIWVLFDEFDKRIAFDARPATLDLPELDRLRQESVVANQAAQTDSFTAFALPSLLSSRTLSRVDLIDASTLHILPQGTSEALDWAGQPSLFTRAHEMGFNAEIVGWYHPYCRVLGSQVARCLARSAGDATPALAFETHSAEMGLARTLLLLFRLQWGNILGLFQGDRGSGWQRIQDVLIQQKQQQHYFELRDRAYAAAIDPATELLFVHLPAPHMFPIYNRRKRSFELDSSLDYLDNLALVDRTVGELRSQLERAGLWDQASLLVTSDHGFRPDLWRGRYCWTPEMDRLTGGKVFTNVPFILKLAGEHQHAVFGQPFSAVVSSDLVLAVLSGQVATAAQAAEWLSMRTSSPVTSTRSGAAGAN